MKFKVTQRKLVLNFEEQVQEGGFDEASVKVQMQSKCEGGPWGLATIEWTMQIEFIITTGLFKLT